MTTATATRAPEFTWRKTRDGEWVVCGNATELRHCAKTSTAVNVTSRDGKVKWVLIDRVGKTFGDGLAYGYIADAPRTRRASSGSCDNCQERPGRHARRDSSGIGGMVCNLCNHEDDYALSFA